MKPLLISIFFILNVQTLFAADEFTITKVDEHISVVKDGNVTCFILERFEKGALSCIGKPGFVKYQDKGDRYDHKFYRKLVEKNLCYIFHDIGKAGIHCFPPYE